MVGWLTQTNRITGVNAPRCGSAGLHKACVSSRLVLLYLLFNIFVVPQQQQVGQGQAEAQVETGRVVDLGVPAAQEEGEDGQTEEEQPDNHAHPVQPLEKRIVRWRLRRHNTDYDQTDFGCEKLYWQLHIHKQIYNTSPICMITANVERWEQLHTV